MKKFYKGLSFLYLITGLFARVSVSHIVFFFPFYHTGGAERVHLDIVKGIVKAVGRRKVIVIFTSPSRNKHFLKDFRKYGYVFDISPFLPNLYYRRIIQFVLKQIGRFQEAVVFGCNNNFFYQILPSLRSTVKRIDLLHAFSPSGGAEDYSLPFVPYLTQRIVINKKTKEDYRKLYSENNIEERWMDQVEIIPNGVDVPSLLKKRFDCERLQTIYCGRISAEKRVHLCVEIGLKTSAISDLKIFGSREMSVNGMEDFYRGVVFDDEKLHEIYDQSNVLLITSISEGFPMVMMEAMARGVVCIATDVGGISEHITNGENGFLVPNFENENKIVDDFENIIRRLANDRDLLKRVSNNAYQYAKENFSRDRFNQAYRKLLL